MALRITPTLLICVAGAAITGGLLALPPADHPVQAVAPGTVAISNFTFTNAPVAPGAVINVSNADGEPHTVTADGGGAQFDSGVIDAGGAGTFTAPAVPGSYAFICSIHPSMHGVLVVTAPTP
jgi:plastocyanin